MSISYPGTNDIDEQKAIQYNITEDDDTFLEEIFEHTFEGIEVIITDTSNHKTLSLEEYLDLASLGAAPADLNSVTITYEVYNNTTSMNLTYTATYAWYTGTKPTSISINTYLASGPLKYGAKTKRGTNSHTLRNVGQTASVTAGGRTDFWQGGFDATINYLGLPMSKHSSLSDPYLYNKKAALYPTWQDSHSRISMYEPDRADWPEVPASQRVSWGTKERTEYITWYHKTYGTPPYPIHVGSQYEIHHIKPRKYGGTNIPSNLIPLPVSFHRTVVNSWWTNY
ncbi:HNH endonuclease signature motif containing protein [Paenibacillus sp. J2TS4]|uniref:HNH endonuclease signature motif containing protein n=1 Tax=Paenibacillus sp. J2TS4 TaxID=2807194 RepID=UPI001B2A0F3B|nr:HNH endonuclease signature motif containing protein [Paenibacillus sp. J2TS4]GIP36459.1 HNH endonuclease [Paenibacillus sp. J2TS4]